MRAGGAKPWLIPCPDSNQQSQFVAQRILELRDEGVPLNEIAVLYRAHYHAMELQMELTRRNIPYVITSGLRFFEQAHVKDVSCFLKVAVNPARRDGVQAHPQAAARYRREDGRQTVGEIPSAAGRRQTVAAHERGGPEKGGR